MKILHIPTGGLFSDGVYSCIEAYVINMDREDLDVTMLATNQPEEAMIKRVNAMNCDITIIPYRKSNPLKYAKDLFLYLKKNKFDIVHVHGSSAIMSIELLAAKLAGCKVRIAHSHNTICENLKADKIFRSFFNHMYSHAFACGEAAGKWLFGNRKFTVIHNGRNLDKYRYDANKRQFWRNKMNINDKSLVVGHVGRFNYQKNQEYAVDVFYETNKKADDAHLILIGDGETSDDIKTKVENLGLEKKVHFLGVIENVEDMLSAMDIMVLPSRYEGLPLVAVEWQIAGLPTIMSDTITDECIITGLVRKESIKEEPKVWSDLILGTEIVNREDTCNQIKQTIREAGYDITIEAQKLKSLYKKYLDEVK